jgi:hypothetical protein
VNTVEERSRNLHKAASYLRNESLQYLRKQTEPLAGMLDLMAVELEQQDLSPVVQHAKREIKHLGLEASETETLLDAIRAFSSALDGDSGTSANLKIMLLVQILRFQNLTELTDNPEEWMEVGLNVWQSTRCAEAFSDDGGKTYYLVSEAQASPSEEPPTHEAVKSDG